MDNKVFFDMSYGVYIAATLDGDKKVGCVANSAFQITAEPARIGISVNKQNYTEDCIRKSGYFTLSVASEHTSMQTIGKFGFYSARDIDKFDGIDYITVGNGYPVIDDNTCSWMLCRVENEVDCGTHTIFIAEVTDGERLTSLTPMTYAYYHKVKGGTTAKNAPTYVEEKPQPEKEKPYKCLLCGYVFEGTAEEFEDLPDDWVCPLCGAGKNLFKQED